MGGEWDASISSCPKLTLKGIGAGGRNGPPVCPHATTNQSTSLNWLFLSIVRATIAYIRLPWLNSFRTDGETFPIMTVCRNVHPMNEGDFCLTWNTSGTTDVKFVPRDDQNNRIPFSPTTII